MEKIINIDGRDVKLKSTGAFLLRYKEFFFRDALADVMRLSEISMDNLSKFDVEIFYNLVWVLAKTADPNIAEINKWLDEFESFPILEVITEVIPLISNSLGGIKKNNMPEKGNRVN